MAKFGHGLRALREKSYQDVASYLLGNEERLKQRIEDILETVDEAAEQKILQYAYERSLLPGAGVLDWESNTSGQRPRPA